MVGVIFQTICLFFVDTFKKNLLLLGFLENIGFFAVVVFAFTTFGSCDFSKDLFVVTFKKYFIVVVIFTKDLFFVIVGFAVVTFDCCNFPKEFVVVVILTKNYFFVIVFVFTFGCCN